MRSSPNRRAAAVAAVMTAALALPVATSAAAEDPIAGFTPSHAARQRAYEGLFQQVVDSASAARTNRAISRRPGLVGTPGARADLEYAAKR